MLRKQVLLIKDYPAIQSTLTSNFVISAGFAVYRPTLLIELVGSELVLNATGISLLFMGIGGIVAPPLSGNFSSSDTKLFQTIFFLTRFIAQVCLWNQQAIMML